MRWRLERPQPAVKPSPTSDFLFNCCSLQISSQQTKRQQHPSQLNENFQLRLITPSRKMFQNQQSIQSLDHWRLKYTEVQSQQMTFSQSPSVNNNPKIPTNYFIFAVKFSLDGWFAHNWSVWNNIKCAYVVLSQILFKITHFWCKIFRPVCENEMISFPRQ